MSKRKNAPANPWKLVVFSADCDEDGNCPVCKMQGKLIDFSECGCPGPTMDDYEYKIAKSGAMYARPKFTN